MSKGSWIVTGPAFNKRYYCEACGRWLKQGQPFACTCDIETGERKYAVRFSGHGSDYLPPNPLFDKTLSEARKELDEWIRRADTIGGAGIIVDKEGNQYALDYELPSPLVRVSPNIETAVVRKIDQGVRLLTELAASGYKETDREYMQVNIQKTLYEALLISIRVLKAYENPHASRSTKLATDALAEITHKLPIPLDEEWTSVSAQEACAHEEIQPGPRIPLRYGSAATECCVKCGAWRQTRAPGCPWETKSLAEAMKEDEEL